ncbi:hypothetical protein EDB80DRAFT_374416 [Ilyonectria destructans]|nr:hypothetical protein EDB80DRAFT_374416 [Ilyonectria destructans]
MAIFRISMSNPDVSVRRRESELVRPELNLKPRRQDLLIRGELPLADTRALTLGKTLRVGKFSPPRRTGRSLRRRSGGPQLRRGTGSGHGVSLLALGTPHDSLIRGGSRWRFRRPLALPQSRSEGGCLSCGSSVSALWGYVLFHDSDGIQCTTLLAAIPVDL